MVSKLKVGYVRNDYPEKRCVITNNDRYDYVMVGRNNLYKFHRYVLKFPAVRRFARPFIYKAFLPDCVDMYHTFNDICITNKKWVVTFETMIPRFVHLLNGHSQGDGEYKHSNTIKYFLKRLAMDNCTRIIALSKCTLEIQSEILKLYPDIEGVIKAKSVVLYPPQRTLIDESMISRKSVECINFCFIGSEFYRKGGGEVVMAFKKVFESLNQEKKNQIKLTLIGDLGKKTNYAHKSHTDKDDFYAGVENIINTNDFITHHERMNNEDFISSLQKTHVGLLPTWADTFGYSVLEFQAAGCPVITTNVRALGEINNNDIGWVFNINKNKLGEVVVNSDTDRIECRKNIINGIFNSVMAIMDNPSLIHEKGTMAYKRIENHHDPKTYNEKIAEIYGK